MRILFAGTPATAATVLDGLLTSGHEVVGVLTREDAPLGRKRILTPSPVAELAETRNLPVIKANKLTETVLEEIRTLRANFAVVVAYGVILKADALEVLPLGWFNLHYSLLPKLRGASPVQRALQNGDSETGVTIFKIDEGLDTGPMLASASTVINPDETAGDLFSRLSTFGVSLLNQEIPKLYSGTFTLTPQTGVATLAPKISRADAKIDFAGNASSAENLVRAMNPEPMAWVFLDGEPMRVLRARALSSSIEQLEPGHVFLMENKVLVSFSDGSLLELLEVQPASKRAMNARDWLNGQGDKVTLS